VGRQSLKSAVTVSLVEEALGGPFVFWDGIENACRTASELGFDAIEIFAPSPTAVDRDELRTLLAMYRLQVAAVGTGAGMVKHGLSLTHASHEIRQRAYQFVCEMISFGAEFGAPAIIGSMQGRWTNEVPRPQALEWLVRSLTELGEFAALRSTVLIYEPLNRYETNLIRTVDEALETLPRELFQNVKLLADLFHMNIEESNIAAALRRGADCIGHIHFVDSNRKAAGMGHLDYRPIIQALEDIGYGGYLSAEALSLPDARTAAQQTITMFRQLTL
jgi:sugar phosphate isomerase/epimerase